MNNKFVSRNVNEIHAERLTVGQRTADALARFAGSWVFIIAFFSLLAIWIGYNSYVLVSRRFDPFPFILLNLILSCLAAIQAPIIMMSQNRMESRDRLRAENDYAVNLKAELEIAELNRKLDHVLKHVDVDRDEPLRSDTEGD